MLYFVNTCSQLFFGCLTSESQNSAPYLRHTRHRHDFVFCFSLRLDYFSPKGMTHLKKFGLKADFRRSFITTSRNPYYDRFIRWQFNLLKKRDFVYYGKRCAALALVGICEFRALLFLLSLSSVYCHYVVSASVTCGRLKQDRGCVKV